jgi:hypothetical protein
MPDFRRLSRPNDIDNNFIDIDIITWFNAMCSRNRQPPGFPRISRGGGGSGALASPGDGLNE